MEHRRAQERAKKKGNSGKSYRSEWCEKRRGNIEMVCTRFPPSTSEKGRMQLVHFLELRAQRRGGEERESAVTGGIPD